VPELQNDILPLLSERSRKKIGKAEFVWIPVKCFVWFYKKGLIFLVEYNTLYSRKEIVTELEFRTQGAFS